MKDLKKSLDKIKYGNVTVANLESVVYEYIKLRKNKRVNISIESQANPFYLQDQVVKINQAVNYIQYWYNTETSK